MTTRTFRVERIEVESKKSFAELAAALEKEVPAADPVVFRELVTSRAPAPEVERKVQAMAGELGFLLLAKVDQGPMTSLLGRPKKLTTYLIGNPLLANPMFEQHPAAGLYVPVRVAIFEDYEGRCHFTYERPSTFLAQFEDDRIRAVGTMLDEKLADLAARLSS